MCVYNSYSTLMDFTNCRFEQVCQDLDEDRIDKLKSSMWAYVNVAATVCVSDDQVMLYFYCGLCNTKKADNWQSCEKVRVALENCEVDKDITAFIADKGTGSEIQGKLLLEQWID